MPWITTDDDVRLNVEATADESKPALLFINPLGADLHIWNDQIEAFSPHFRVVRFDDRGHGLSGTSENPYTIDRLGRDARDVLDGLGIETAHVVGLSKGGMTAAWLAINAQDYVQKLVIACTAPHLPPREMWEGRAKTARNDGVAALADAVIGRWFTEGFRIHQPATMAKIRAMVLSTSAEGYAACCEALAELDLRDDLELIQSPTLVICGDSDPGAQPAKTREWMKAIDGATLQVIKGASHIANVEQPAAFNKTVLDFLLAD